MSGGAGGNVSVAALRDAATKLRAKGAKVLLSVAGGVIPGCSGDWAALLADKKGTVKDELLAVMEAGGFDGIDIDIEGELLTRIDQQGNYTPFIAALSKALKARGKLLTVATASYEGGMIPVSSIRYFDLVMPMSYDAIGPSWGQPGSEHSTEAQAARDVALWLARGVKPERLALGVPYYGYGYGKLAGGDFRSLLAAHGEAALKSDVIGKACAGCDYITFNSPDTIRRKAELAKARAGGVMVWEITQDTDDQLLAGTIAKVLRN
jgi:GH18 family chitinase